VIVLFYERKIKPNIIQPTILYNHPATSNRLPNQNDNDLSKSDAFHLVAMGTEILRAYSNASYPILESDKSQICKNIEIEKSGICEVDETLIQALEYGVPPMSGVSLDIDKLIALICNQKNLKEVILFPITR
jgi:lysyl-tRNA synthetase class 2